MTNVQQNSKILMTQIWNLGFRICLGFGVWELGFTKHTLPKFIYYSCCFTKPPFSIRLITYETTQS